MSSISLQIKTKWIGISITCIYLKYNIISFLGCRKANPRRRYCTRCLSCSRHHDLAVVPISPPSCIINILPVNMIPSPGNSTLSYDTPPPQPQRPRSDHLPVSQPCGAYWARGTGTILMAVQLAVELDTTLCLC